MLTCALSRNPKQNDPGRRQVARMESSGRTDEMGRFFRVTRVAPRSNLGQPGRTDESP